MHHNFNPRQRSTTDATAMAKAGVLLVTVPCCASVRLSANRTQRLSRPQDNSLRAKNRGRGVAVNRKMYWKLTLPLVHEGMRRRDMPAPRSAGCWISRQRQSSSARPSFPKNIKEPRARGGRVPMDLKWLKNRLSCEAYWLNLLALRQVQI